MYIGQTKRKINYKKGTLIHSIALQKILMSVIVLHTYKNSVNILKHSYSHRLNMSEAIQLKNHAGNLLNCDLTPL